LLPLRRRAPRADRRAQRAHVPARWTGNREGCARRPRPREDRFHARRNGNAARRRIAAGRAAGVAAAGEAVVATSVGARSARARRSFAQTQDAAMTAAAGADLVVQAPQVLREDLEILRLMTGAQGIEPIGRAACDAYRLHEPQDRAGVSEACAAAQYDYAFVPHQRALDRVRLVAMDMDSTLITIECIDEIAAMHGIGDDVAAITAAAMRGEIDFTASLTRRVALLEGLPIEALARVYDER